MWSFIVFLVIGIIAGWLAGLIFKGRGFGLIWDMVIGVAGSFIGGFVFKLIGVGAYGFLGSVFTAVVGALLLLFIINWIKK
ncbi:MAG TPA: GlsB/YeaQ/YmgE family stress response membrane protein [Spirochaetota bacterium]|nr:GlsB/YeaQ/YmgE family stress response membrane protein [Spirochaetota bacterium]HNT12645.1 GlsB/YeaQ/YmgE family stress response membrane protein [Spirochaetota bacterium]HNV48286.1 GlsB/YeaQ/YmgE family stress response membrane protein [Spirochaetota bacterium]HOS41757.1 GlsB/YeaQ/YmgE family stress response membrane protein [Spirochaetota bacterium]HPU89628.1 GlsB/YeaQ/YmgE family stress response membrane protein [Spirochaetota bacterium]